MFEMSDFNMILMMDFLRKNETKINYQCKKVWFNLMNRDQFNFGDRHIKSMIINAIKARKMLSKRYTSFLAHVVSKVKSGSSMKEKLVV